MKRDGRNARAIDLLSIGQAAAMLGLSKRYIYVLIERDTLNWYDVGGRKMLHRLDVLALRDERKGA